MDFKHILGHQGQIERLQHDLQSGNLAHAYLLAGPAGVGKMTIARIFAKMLQVQDLPPEKAQRIENLIDQGAHLDTHVVAAEKEGESIKIETVRSLLGNLSMTGDSRHRILVIEDIDRLTPEAANAMLKMLEEPPSKVVYLFTSSRPNLILDTILSRVRRIDFSMMGEEELRAALQKRYRLKSADQLDRIAKLSMGRIAQAIKLAEDEEVLAIYENVYQGISNFLRDRKITDAFAFIAQIHEDKLLTSIFVDIAFVVLREQLLNDVREKGIIERDEELDRHLSRVQSLFELRKLSSTNVNNRLLMENFILSL